MSHKRTRSGYERHLNDHPVPEHDKKSNGGQCSDNQRFGSWLRIYDPYRFSVEYQEWRLFHEQREKESTTTKETT